MGHQLIYNKSHFTELCGCAWCSSCAGTAQLCCHPSKPITVTLIMDDQKPIINMFSHGYMGFKSLACTLYPYQAIQSVQSPSVCVHMHREKGHQIWFLDATVKRTVVGVEVRLRGFVCVCDCGCHYTVSVNIHSALTFNMCHLFALVLPGLLWKGSYLLNFHRRQSW